MRDRQLEGLAIRHEPRRGYFTFESAALTENIGPLGLETTSVLLQLMLRGKQLGWQTWIPSLDDSTPQTGTSAARKAHGSRTFTGGTCHSHGAGRDCANATTERADLRLTGIFDAGRPRALMLYARRHRRARRGTERRRLDDSTSVATYRASAAALLLHSFRSDRGFRH